MSIFLYLTWFFPIINAWLPSTITCNRNLLQMTCPLTPMCKFNQHGLPSMPFTYFPCKLLILRRRSSLFNHVYTTYRFMNPGVKPHGAQPYPYVKGKTSETWTDAKMRKVEHLCVPLKKLSHYSHILPFIHSSKSSPIWQLNYLREVIFCIINSSSFY